MVRADVLVCDQEPAGPERAMNLADNVVEPLEMVQRSVRPDEVDALSAQARSTRRRHLVADLRQALCRCGLTRRLDRRLGEVDCTAVSNAPSLARMRSISPNPQQRLRHSTALGRPARAPPPTARTSPDPTGPRALVTGDRTVEVRPQRRESVEGELDFGSVDPSGPTPSPRLPASLVGRRHRPSIGFARCRTPTAGPPRSSTSATSTSTAGLPVRRTGSTRAPTRRDARG